jgi:hypothetical protein
MVALMLLAGGLDCMIIRSLSVQCALKMGKGAKP